MMKNNPPKKQTLLIIAVVVIGILLGALILGTDKAGPAEEQPEHDNHVEAKDQADGGHHEEASEPAKGPHGGKLFTKDGYAVEVTIFEQDAPPEFRLYTYQNGKPLKPDQSRITVTLERLGRKPQEFAFVKEKDYLKSEAVVEEPHSFTVTVNARHQEQAYQFSYTQEEARVTMSDRQLRQNGVEILTAGPARIQTALQLIGEIKLNEDRTVRVVPRLSGIVEKVSASAGDQVKKGQILAVISSQLLADQRSELLAAQKRHALARITYEREKKLWEEKISAEQDYLQAEAALQEAQIALQSARQKLASLGGNTATGDLTRYEIRSPIDGVITDKRISVGTVMKDDADIFTISDLSSVWVDLTVRAQDLNAVKTGQQATVKATAFDAQEVGKVTYIGSVVGEQNRTATARVVLPNPKGVWRPGLPVNVSVVADEANVPVAVAVEGLQTVRDWTVVFGRYGTYLEARPLELGRNDGKFVEVIQGLHAGEAYAAKNSYLIKAELGKASASHDH
jgi:cobalt-zinc-cadmium efflux system membrane fusion protein